MRSTVAISCALVTFRLRSSAAELLIKQTAQVPAATQNTYFFIESILCQGTRMASFAQSRKRQSGFATRAMDKVGCLTAALRTVARAVRTGRPAATKAPLSSGVLRLREALSADFFHSPTAPNTIAHNRPECSCLLP